MDIWKTKTNKQTTKQTRKVSTIKTTRINNVNHNNNKYSGTHSKRRIRFVFSFLLQWRSKQTLNSANKFIEQT